MDNGGITFSTIFSSVNPINVKKYTRMITNVVGLPTLLPARLLFYQDGNIFTAINMFYLFCV